MANYSPAAVGQNRQGNYIDARGNIISSANNFSPRPIASSVGGGYITDNRQIIPPIVQRARDALAAQANPASTSNPPTDLNPQASLRNGAITPASPSQFPTDQAAIQQQQAQLRLLQQQNAALASQGLTRDQAITARAQALANGTATQQGVNAINTLSNSNPQTIIPGANFQTSSGQQQQISYHGIIPTVEFTPHALEKMAGQIFPGYNDVLKSGLPVPEQLALLQAAKEGRLQVKNLYTGTPYATKQFTIVPSQADIYKLNSQIINEPSVTTTPTLSGAFTYPGIFQGDAQRFAQQVQQQLQQANGSFNPKVLPLQAAQAGAELASAPFNLLQGGYNALAGAIGFANLPTSQVIPAAQQNLNAVGQSVKEIEQARSQGAVTLFGNQTDIGLGIRSLIDVSIASKNQSQFKQPGIVYQEAKGLQQNPSLIPAFVIGTGVSLLTAEVVGEKVLSPLLGAGLKAGSKVPLLGRFISPEVESVGAVRLLDSRGITEERPTVVDSLGNVLRTESVPAGEYVSAEAQATAKIKGGLGKGGYANVNVPRASIINPTDVNAPSRVFFEGESRTEFPNKKAMKTDVQFNDLLGRGTVNAPKEPNDLLYGKAILNEVRTQAEEGRLVQDQLSLQEYFQSLVTKRENLPRDFSTQVSIGKQGAEGTVFAKTGGVKVQGTTFKKFYFDQEVDLGVEGGKLQTSSQQVARGSILSEGEKSGKGFFKSTTGILKSEAQIAAEIKAANRGAVDFQEAIGNFRKSSGIEPSANQPIDLLNDKPNQPKLMETKPQPPVQRPQGGLQGNSLFNDQQIDFRNNPRTAAGASAIQAGAQAGAESLAIESAFGQAAKGASKFLGGLGFGLVEINKTGDLLRTENFGASRTSTGSIGKNLLQNRNFNSSSQANKLGNLLGNENDLFQGNDEGYFLKIGNPFNPRDENTNNPVNEPVNENVNEPTLTNLNELTQFNPFIPILNGSNGVPPGGSTPQPSQGFGLKVQGFLGYVKAKPSAKSKYVLVTPRAVTRQQALNRAQDVADNTTSRSIKVVPTKQMVQFKQVQDLLGYKFQPAKRNQNIMVERVTYAIDTSGEKRGLSVARYLKQQQQNLFGSSNSGSSKRNSKQVDFFGRKGGRHAKFSF